MTASKPVDPLDNKEVNQAAYNFQQSIKTIKQRTRAVSKKSMERVFDAVMEFPLAKVEPNFRNQQEHELFILALNALAAKNVMMSAIMQSRQETDELLKQAQEATANVGEEDASNNL